MTDMGAGGVDPKDFGSAFKRFLDQAVATAPEEEPFFVERLNAHFGADSVTLPIVAEEFETYDQPNLQMAVDAYLAAGDRRVELLGVKSAHKQAMGLTFSDLLTPHSSAVGDAAQGPVEYINLPLEEGRMLTCIQFGLLLIGDGDAGLAVLLRGPGPRAWEKFVAEVMAPTREAANRFLGDIRAAMNERNVYRGHVVSVSAGSMDQLEVNFHTLPTIDSEGIILPPGVMERIQRHTIGFWRHRETLLASGRHLKRGILLHGPPGTGKTLTAMFLAAEMRGRTVLLLTGRNLGLIKQSCAMARMLAPSMVVLEDVDLVAEERTGTGACAPILFELLNEMDGLAGDVDVIFLLTTNRPDLLEPALAARPGRVDQAIELPLPDESCRRRLLRLYGRGLDLEVEDLDGLIQRTEGTSGAFIRELLRKAALLAAEDGDGIVVRDHHFLDALRELVVHGGELTKNLLGVQAPVSRHGRPDPGLE